MKKIFNYIQDLYLSTDTFETITEVVSIIIVTIPFIALCGHLLGWATMVTVMICIEGFVLLPLLAILKIIMSLLD